MIADAAALLAVVTLGLSAGAVLTEGAVLVPFWRSLEPHAFLAWYRRFGGLLLAFFGPLEIAAAAATASAAVLRWRAGDPRSTLQAVSALLATLVLAAFPAYFQRVNASFVDGTIAPGEVASELRRWSRWHWTRVALAVAAFAAAVAAGEPD